MTPEIFANYFLASAGAGGALIGLLFVAVSIHPEYTLGGDAHPVRRGVASGAFTALTNAFFVSMSALIPLTNVGGIAVVVGVVDVFITLQLGLDLLQRARTVRAQSGRWGAMVRVIATLLVSVALYGYEGIIGVGLLLHPRDVGLTLSLAELLLGVYAVGLARAWELLGGPGGMIARLLNPLQDLEEAPPTPGAAPADERTHAVQVDARPTAPTTTPRSPGA
jgi:hypothetical protein